MDGDWDELNLASSYINCIYDVSKWSTCVVFLTCDFYAGFY